MGVMAALRRNLLFRAHEKLAHRRTLAYAHQLESSQWLSPVELRKLQRGKLSALLQHANTNVPFYGARFGELSWDSAELDTFGVLNRLPLLSKSDIRNAGRGMWWPDSPGGLTSSCTGGSTGEPLVFCLDRRRQAYDQAARIRTHRWFGIELGDCEIMLWGSPIERTRTDRMRSVRDRLFNQHLLDAFRMSPQRMDCYLDQWERLAPAALFGYPSSIALFARHARKRGRSLNTKSLRAVFVTGEVCHPHDRADIENFFQVPVADNYGSREAGFIAHQCPHGSMHITAENVIVEIVRESLRVPAGETGEIVVTHLDAYGMPFIRYRTGDFGRLLGGRCRCGRGLPLMDVVQGRSTDFLMLPDGTIKHALSIIYPLRAMPGVERFRVTQQADYGVIVEVVADKSLTADAVKTRVRPVLGNEIGLGIRFVDFLEESPSGKFRYVISHVKREEAQVPA